MSYVGLFLLIWLVVGFISGITEVYIEKTLDGEKFEEKIKAFYERNGRNEMTEHVVNTLTNKKFFIAMCTLLGFIAWFAQISKFLRVVKDAVFKNENK